MFILAETLTKRIFLITNVISLYQHLILKKHTMSNHLAIEKYKSLLVGLGTKWDLIKNIIVVDIISFNFFENSKGLLLK